MALARHIPPAPEAAGIARTEPLASPLGTLELAFAADGDLLRLRLPGRGPVRARGRRPAGAPSRAALRSWIEAWFGGGAAAFPGRWRMPGSTPFQRRVYEQVANIPPGLTRGYGEVAALCGSPGAARAVGNAMARNPLPLIVPCHRVVGASDLGGFGGGLRMKAELLAGEAPTS